MLISEVKILLNNELQGDNADYKLEPIILRKALLDVLRRTKPRTHIIKDEYKGFSFAYFRKISKSFYLRYPTTDLNDTSKLDMEEELCDAVVYFLCASFSLTRSREFASKAEEIIAIYDTNVNLRDDERYLNCYLIKDDSTPITPIDPTPQPKPILKKIVIEVGKSVEVLVDSGDGGDFKIEAGSEFEASLSGNILTIKALKATDNGVVTIRNSAFIYTINIFSAVSDGGIID